VPSEEVGKLVLICAGALFLLRWNLWRAILFLRPQSTTVEADAPADQAKPPAPLEKAEAGLAALGFTRLGSHLERSPLSRTRLGFDYVHAGEHVFATTFLSPRGEPRLYFLTPTANGGFVLTADHRRPAHEVPGRYLSGGMDETSPERIFKAHQRRVATVGEPAVTPTLEARVEVGRAWYAGDGRREVRQQNALGLLWTLGSLGMVCAAFLTLW
jgi:hypothetical protein